MDDNYDNLEEQSSNNTTMETRPETGSNRLHEVLPNHEVNKTCTNLNASEEPRESIENDSKEKNTKYGDKKTIYRRKIKPGTFIPTLPLLYETQCVSSPAFYGLGKTNDELNDQIVLKSHVYVTARNGSQFRLNFEATDVQLEPLYLSPRPIRAAGNDKHMQVVCHHEYVDDYNKASSRPRMKVLTFVVDPDLDVPKRVKLPPIRVYKTKITAENETISKPKQASTKGFIFVKIDDILMKIVVVSSMPITKLRLPVSEDVKAVIEKLNMPSNDHLKNRAKIIVRNKNDLLRISFTLSNCFLSELPERKSKSNQTDSRILLHTEVSTISNRVVQISIPESTYVYKDPMVEARQLNRHFMSLNILPEWKFKMFHKRLSEIRGGGAIQIELDKAVKGNRGSSLVFEGLNAIATANGGVLCGRIAKGEDKYEDKMYEYLEEGNAIYDSMNANSSALLYWKPRR